MKAKSIQGNSPEGIRIALSDSITDDFSPTLAIAFVTVNQDWKAVRKLLDDHKISIFGATTDSQFTNEGIQENGIVIMLLDLNPEWFKILLTDVDSKKTRELGSHIGEFGIKNYNNPGFILSAAHIELPFEVIIDSIVTNVGADIMLVGGVSGSSQTFAGTIFTNEQHSNMGFITLILDQDKITMSGIAVSGWKPVGTEKTITRKSVV